MPQRRRYQVLRRYAHNYSDESALHTAFDVAGIQDKPRRHRFHLFRHTCGNILYALMGDIRLAKDALGKFRGYGKPCWLRKIEYDIPGLDSL